MDLDPSTAGRQPSLHATLAYRERGTLHFRGTQCELHFPQSMARRLKLEHELLGHQGCVNRLAWNAGGSMLASASDDRQVMLWKYPDAKQMPIQVETEHQGNIFGVRFLPDSGDRRIVTGAMDFLVQLHTLETKPSRPTPRTTNTSPLPNPGINNVLRDFEGAPSVAADSSTKSFACHRGRVKDVEVEPHNPHLFWSASEDGTVRQFDVRCSDQDTYESKNVLLGVRGRTRSVQLKGLSINKARPWQLGVACGDPFVRIFDMRKLSIRGPKEDVAARPMLKLAPPHLYHKPIELQTLSNQPHSTHISFSNRGDKVLATYHSDHAYSFDVGGAAPDAFRSMFWRGHATGGGRPVGADSEARLQRCKFNGNAAMFEHEFTTAIRHYTAGLRHCPGSTALLAGRASAYMQRKWEGDASYALLNCEHILCIDPTSARAHLLRCQALLALHCLSLASKAADAYVALFPTRGEEIARIRRLIEQKQKEAEKARAQREQMRAQKEEIRKRRRQRVQMREGRSAMHGEVEEDEDAEEVGGTGGVAAVLGQAAIETHVSGRDVEVSTAALGSEEEVGGYHSDSGASSDEVGERAEGPSSLRVGSPPTAHRHHGEPSSGAAGGSGEVPSLWRTTLGGQRLIQRYIGQCNVQTDIKECTFVGDNDGMVACGSDDGRVFIYNAETGLPLRVLDADGDVANCVQCHPTQTVLATSGIESMVKLWSPGEQDVEDSDLMTFVSLNQERMKDGPHYYHQSALHTAMRAHVLQTLTENPELIPELRSLLMTQSGGTRLGLLPENVELDDSNVSCRMN